MSDVNIAKRKEKCENCTKQVIIWICITVLSCVSVNSLYMQIWKTLPLIFDFPHTVQQEAE